MWVILTHNQKLLPDLEMPLSELRGIHTKDRREEPQWQLSLFISVPPLYSILDS
jgi:hypothetical protein